MNTTILSPHVLNLDCPRETAQIATFLRTAVGDALLRRGAVVAISGGIDSAVCAALAVTALGKERVFGLLLPEKESSQRSTELGKAVALTLRIPYQIVDLTQALCGLGCYEARDQAIRSVFPDYGPGWRNKIVIGGGQSGGMNFFHLVVKDPTGTEFRKRLPHKAYLEIVAAQNHKQRTRKTLEYHHADRLNYAVVGTPNRLEYDQGFFVRGGDGLADVKPIAHLYKTQVYAMGRHLGLPEEVCNANPTTDTYTLDQGQDEFYFALPYEQMDLALWSKNHGIPPAKLAGALNITEEQAVLIYKDIERKRQATRPLHAYSLLARSVPEIDPDLRPLAGSKLPVGL